MGRLEKLHQRRWGVLVGAVAALLGTASLPAGLLDPLNDFGLDLHFRWLGAIDADPRIVLVDINDHALRVVGEWPWPRRRYAQIVRTLDELGAKVIALDLILADPASPTSPGLGKHYDVDTELVILGDSFGYSIVYDDDELRDAIVAAGNVYLSMLFRLAPPGIDPSAIRVEAMAQLRADETITRRAFETALRSAFPGAGPWVGDETLYHRARLAAALEEDFSFEAAAIAQRLAYQGASGMWIVEQHLPAAKRDVARRAARSFLAGRPDAGFAEFFAHVLPHRDPQALSPDREDLIEVFRAQRAFAALAQRSPAVPVALTGRVAHGFDLTLPVEKFAIAAKGIGFVSFEREESGAVVREIPLVAEVEGRLVLQLGLLVAADVLGLDPQSVIRHGDCFHLGGGEARRRICVDSRGRTVINWHRPRGLRRWEESFRHIPVSRVLEIPLNLEAVAENEKRLALAVAGLVETRHADTPGEYQRYVRLINDRLAVARETATRSGKLDEINAEIRRIEEDAAVWLRRAYELWHDMEPVNEAERVQRNEIEQLYARMGEGRLAKRLAGLNDDLAARIASRRAELRPQIEGKICLVGYTASGMADLVSSPVFESMPGVMTHANVVNMFLQNAPVVRLPSWLNIAVALLVAGFITLSTCMLGPVGSALTLGAFLSLVVAGGGWLFTARGCYLASPAVCVEAGMVWACVAAYRQFTEQRTRRRYQRALAQYTSPAVAARIVSSAVARDMSPRRAEVTCFFSDLYGFTRLSERLGAERTRLVLNPYLGTISRVLVDHHAIVNKFMGDGVFAFFNAPIWPCEDHSEAACDCALAAVEAFAALNMPSSDGGMDQPLRMRIGMSTGEVFVGDYGSDTKLDYTCIGDTVNVAARLEQANKAFGTTILLDDPCRRRVGARFAFRTMGRIEVPGRVEPAVVHELVGLNDRLTDDARKYLAAFEQAVREYQAGHWDACLSTLGSLEDQKPDDGVARCYRRAAMRFKLSPPGADWNAALPVAW